MNLVQSGLDVLPIGQNVELSRAFNQSMVRSLAPGAPASVTAPAFTTLSEQIAEGDLVSSRNWDIVDVAQEKAPQTDANVVVTGTAEGVILGAALATAKAVNDCNLGFKMLHQGAGVYLYAQNLNIIGPALASCRPFQVGAAMLADKAAGEILNRAVVGTLTLGSAATVASAVLTGITVLKVGEITYNCLIAKTEADKISLSLVDCGKKVFSMLTGFTGFGKTAAAA